jgi:hypothetical protein
MLKTYPLDQAMGEFDFVPQAVLAEDFFVLAKHNKLKFEKGHDDLDYYVGAAAVLDDLVFTVMHYDGHPPHTSTIYLPFDIRDVNEVTKSILRITKELGLTEKSLLWQRNGEFKLMDFGAK